MSNEELCCSCKYFQYEDINGVGVCERLFQETTVDDFCGFWEKKEGIKDE